MKKIIYIITLIISITIIASCSDEELLFPAPTKQVKTIGVRTPQDALEIANRAALSLDSVATRSDNHRTASLSRISAIVELGTRSTGSGFYSDTLMYIVNYPDEQGFAIVSANEKTPDILALVDKGNYYSFDNCKIEGFNDFIKLAKIYVREYENINSNDEFVPLHPEWTDTINRYRLLPNRVTWGQGFPAGMYCPNNICGCAPLAAAQILEYYKYPTSINLTYVGKDLLVQTLDWDSIRLHKLTPPSYITDITPYCTASDSSHNAIGRLCRQLGQLMNCQYNEGATGTTQNNILPCFLSLGYTSDGWNDYFALCTMLHIGFGHPVYMIGRTNESGHAWVVDGYMTRTYTAWGEIIGGDDYTSVIEYYNHVNWGWNGYYNGYYLDGVFNTSNYFKADEMPYNLGNLNYDFNTELQYMIPTPSVPY